MTPDLRRWTFRTRRTLSESSECRGWWSVDEPVTDRVRALFRVQHGRVELEVIDTGDVRLTLPRAHRRRDGIAPRSDRVAGSDGPAPFHDHVDRAADSDEEHRQRREPSRAVGENLGVVVADVDHDMRPALL